VKTLGNFVIQKEKGLHLYVLKPSEAPTYLYLYDLYGFEENGNG
jgi:hypothetical protein